MKLSDLQKAFVEGIYFRNSLHNNEYAPLEDFLCQPLRTNLQTRFNAYSEGLSARVISAMTEQYPVLLRILGDMEFERLCQSYTRANPSLVPDIGQIGLCLPEFLEKNSFPAELAKLERALTQSFHAEDAPPFSLPDGSLEDVQLRLQKSTILLRSHFELTPLIGTPELKSARTLPEFIVVSRSSFTVQCSAAHPKEFVLLERFAEGETLAAAVEDLNEGELSLLPEWFESWGRRNYFRAH